MPEPVTRPTARKAEFSQRELRYIRILGVAAAAAIILLGLVHETTDRTRFDPLELRLLLAALYMGLVASSYLYAGRAFLYLIYAACGATTLWLVSLTAANGFIVDYTLSLVIVVAAVGLLFRSSRHLLGYTSLTAVAVLAAVVTVQDPAVDVRLFLGQMALLFVLTHVVQEVRLRAQADLAESEERFAVAAQGANDGLWDWHVADDRIHYSSRWKGQLGEADHDVGESPDEWWSRVHPDDFPRVRRTIDAHLEGETPHLEMEYRMQHRDGSYRWFLTRGIAIRDAAGNLQRVAGSQTDVTERRHAENDLRESQRALATLLNHLPGMAYRVRNDPQWTLEFASDGAVSLTGYPVEALIGNAEIAFVDLIHAEDRERVWAEVQAALAADRPFRLNYRLITATGEERWVWEQGEAVRDEAGEVVALEGFIADVTEQKRAEDQLLHDALHDLLTGLPNRALFLDRLEQAMKYARRRENYSFAVLFLDLDRFKLINDGMGHHAGDQLLVAVAERLKACLRAEDTVARLGGDEFAILIEELASSGEPGRIAERIQTALSPTFRIGTREVYTSATIGIAVGDPRYASPDDMLRDADTAMYKAKSRARGQHEIFDTAMHTQVVAQLQLESDLRRVLDRGELRLVYQPIFRLPDRRLIGFEALVRWQHADRGMLLPDEFIPVAEETGLILPLGWWVLGEACTQLAEWRRTRPPARDLTVSVNVSGKQFMQDDLVDGIERLLGEHALPSEALQLEITESVVMRDANAGAAILGRLKDRGVRIAIDDFGTGYSSLSYLHQFPIHFLKIDRVFVHHLADAGADPSRLIQTMISLADSLGIQTVAEGVETGGQLETLERLGCGYAQGNLFSKPVDAETATGFIVESTDTAGAALVSEREGAPPRRR